MNLIARYWTNGKKKPAISNGFCSSLDFLGLSIGGDEGDRTPGLGVANAALSQLSYIPVDRFPDFRGRAYMIPCEAVKELLSLQISKER
jgi:hypothetical protein